MLRRNYQIQEAEILGQEMTFNWICKYFEFLQKFYQSAAERQEGVLVILD